MKIVGMMSGTSLDGQTIALVSLEDSEYHSTSDLRNAIRNAHFISGKTFPFPKDLQTSLKKIASIENSEKTSFFARVHGQLGDFSAERLRKFLLALNEKQIDLVGFHGQTVYHEPHSKARTITFQIGDPSPISFAINSPVVSDFRSMDTAAGGQGAPLVPIVDYLKYGGEKTRIVLNLGGISNFTFLPRNSGLRSARAFDVGPGNVLVDGAMWRLFNKRFDAEGRIAKKGKYSEVLLNYIISMDDFSKLPYPKSTGRERYSETFLGKILSRAEALRLSPVDTVTTISMYTIYMIDFHLRVVAKREKAEIDEIIIGGGGSKNSFLLKAIRESRPNVKMSLHDDYGVPAPCWEAFSFAVMAYLTFHRLPGNVPSATGASRPVVLGRINYAPPISFVE